MQKDFFSYDNLSRLKSSHSAWRLLCVDNSPFILSFLYKVFIEPNIRAISYSELLAKLDDYLFFIHSVYDEGLYTRKAKEYIDDWANQESGFIRVYYVQNHDEPEVDITPSTEKVFEWIHSIEHKQFVGTESKLFYLFQLIRDMVNNTELDADLRLAELERQKSEIELEIIKVRSGIVSSYDNRQIREQFAQIQDTAQSLVSDFRQVEYNFRSLDMEMRERIAISQKSKGELLDEIFYEQDIIKDSDQGRSFKGFWEYLMSPDRQDELKLMLNKIFDLPDISKDDQFLKNIDVHLLNVGERVYRSYNLIAEQLRKYLDSYTYLEYRRILALIKSIECSVIEAKDDGSILKLSTEIMEPKPSIESIMSRPLFSPPKNPVITNNILVSGEANFDLGLLFAQHSIDENKLRDRIWHMLQFNSQVALSEILAKYPLEHGLAEIITYLHLATKMQKSVIDNSTITNLVWSTEDNVKKQAQLPNIIFVR